MTQKRRIGKIAQILTKRDAEWTLALGVTEKVLTPEEAKKWLEHDRIVRARNVSDARRLRGPFHW